MYREGIMKPFGGYIPKDQLNGDEEYVEFYKAEDVHRELERLEKELKAKDEELQQHVQKIESLRKHLEELQAQTKTARVVAEDHGKEIHKTQEILAVLRESLGFYAQKSNWITIHDREENPHFGKFLVESDQGETARRALELMENTEV
jgi:chromosome segregation ATPase